MSTLRARQDNVRHKRRRVTAAEARAICAAYAANESAEMIAGAFGLCDSSAVRRIVERFAPEAKYLRRCAR